LDVRTDQIDDVRRFEHFLNTVFGNLGHGSCCGRRVMSRKRRQSLKSTRRAELLAKVRREH
jgi:hypothetical protein